jgi:hypothetical protein
MKIRLIAAFAVAILASAPTFSSHAQGLEPGDAAPLQQFSMMDVGGEMTTLQDLKLENGLLVIYSCNSCPFVVGREGRSDGWEGRYNGLNATAGALKIGMVLVNSNSAKRASDDSFTAMKQRALDAGYTMPYVLDEDNKLADAFTARTTPHVFLFNGDLELVYSGAIDDNGDDADDVKKYWLNDALAKLSAGQRAKPNQTKALGCSIKRAQ